MAASQTIMDYHKNYNLGVNKTRNKILYDAEKDAENGLTPKPIPSYYVLRKVYNERNLIKHKPNHKRVGRTRYSVCSSNLIWHVDIHFIKGNK